MTTPEGFFRASLGLLLCLSVVVTGCGIRSTRTQTAEHSTLKFTGDLSGVKIQIDDGDRFVPESGHYRVSTGTHEIKVYRNNEKVVHKTVFLESQTTREIHVP